jgi:hypothetical protein
MALTLVGTKPSKTDDGIRWTRFLTKADAKLLSGLAEFHKKRSGL